MDKAVILLAGIGSRLRPLTDHVPKPLLEIAGQTLLDRAIGALRSNGIESIVLVTGYRADQVRSHVERVYADGRVELVHNAQYETTNNALSVLLTRPVMRGCGMVLLDGDILFDPAIIAGLLNDRSTSALALRRSDDLGDEEMKVALGFDGGVVAIGKNLAPELCVGESIGIEWFTPTAADHLFHVLEDRVNARGFSGEFYEESFQQMIREGAEIRAIDTADAACIEIDTLDDYLAAIGIAEIIGSVANDTTPPLRMSPPIPALAHPIGHS